MIPFTDLKKQYKNIKKEIDTAVLGVIERAQFILGPEVRELEQKVSSYMGCKEGIGVASGTDAILLALEASGVGPEDEVITTALSFVATAESIDRAGAVPVFVDIEPDSCNIDASKIEEKITPKTKAIVPVHLFGQMADMEKIMEIAKKYDLKVIEDCAQSMGADLKGRKAGSWGDAGCFSFFPAKVLGCFGDGGMVMTDDPGLAENVRILRKHGSSRKNYQIMKGYNSRLDTLQAAVLLVKFPHLDEWVKMRNKNAKMYTKLLQDVAQVKPPVLLPERTHAFNYYTLTVGQGIRDKLKDHLSAQEISNGIYYPLSLHLQEVYKKYGYKAGDCPVSESLQDCILSLPLFPEMEESQIRTVIDSIKQFFS